MTARLDTPVSHKDIASRVKVTQSTVSRALDPAKCHLIASDTREKILSVAKELGFRSNIFARRMRNLRSETITLVIDDINHHADLNYIDFRSHAGAFGEQITAGVIDGAAECGLDVKLLPLHSQHPLSAQELDKRIGFPYSDGVLFLGFHYMKDIYNVILNRGLPCLAISPHASDLPLATVSVNPISGVRAALQHLIDKGHRRIAYSAHRPVTEDYIPQRYCGYELEMTASGFFDPELLLVAPDEISIRRMVENKKILAKFTAIMCVNDAMADRWRRELVYRGYRIPEDFAIIGYDNNPMFRDLSTVDLRAYECGNLAAKRLIESINSSKLVENCILDGCFIPRLSS
jgi:DNA-binding LacI/PurR family transcriptional regulator